MVLFIWLETVFQGCIFFLLLLFSLLFFTSKEADHEKIGTLALLLETVDSVTFFNKRVGIITLFVRNFKSDPFFSTTTTTFSAQSSRDYLANCASRWVLITSFAP